MQKKICLFTFVALIASTLQAQEYYWKVGLDYFFDNTEYENSSFLDSETMNGIWLNPMGTIEWNDKHSINAGVNLLNIPGMGKAINTVDVTLYYQHTSPNVLFRAGSFPRDEVLGNYNTFFFKDSINHFTPLMWGGYSYKSGTAGISSTRGSTGRATPLPRAGSISSWDCREKHPREYSLPIFNRTCFITRTPGRRHRAWA